MWIATGPLARQLLTGERRPGQRRREWEHKKRPDNTHTKIQNENQRGSDFLGGRSALVFVLYFVVCVLSGLFL